MTKRGYLNRHNFNIITLLDAVIPMDIYSGACYIKPYIKPAHVFAPEI